VPGAAGRCNGSRYPGGDVRSSAIEFRSEREGVTGVFRRSRLTLTRANALRGNICSSKTAVPFSTN